VFMITSCVQTVMGVMHYRASLGRLGVDQLGLYQIHWPAFGTNWFRNDAFVKVGRPPAAFDPTQP
jgi:hypothetical protein